MSGSILAHFLSKFELIVRVRFSSYSMSVQAYCKASFSSMSESVLVYFEDKVSFQDHLAHCQGQFMLIFNAV